MFFSEFANRLASVIRAGGSTDKFTRSLFESIVTDEGQEVLNEYSSSSYKGFYNGNTAITRIATKVNAYIEPMSFSAYIHTFSDAAVENICRQFADVLPAITAFNAGDLLADLFVDIITEAAGTNKKSTPKSADDEMPEQLALILDSHNGVAPDLAYYQDGVLYLSGKPDGSDENEVEPFKTYLETASSFYSTKKTLLYAENPHPFYELYVCNDIRYQKFHVTGTKITRPEKTITDATVRKLESESKYIIIEGTGGIGKSMMLTHFFLSSAKEYEEVGKVPVFVSLKDYKESTSNIVEFVWNAIKSFDTKVTQKQIIEALECKRMVLLLDGLDEIQTSVRDSYDLDLDAFIKSYPGNMIIITSRPVNSFVSYSKFYVFDIEPLSKEQALTLVDKLDFWDVTAKQNFMEALDKHLYISHNQFASNPLLLTIMLMTYSSFGEVPAKMHVFYSKAYETMARLHDASKGSFKRPLHTTLTPEDFAKYFSEFCARTYKDEVLEFTELSFSTYMGKVLKGSFAEQNGITPHDFLLDLTDNLCIMYREGEKIYFIHRSFQEYFAAVHFASGYDAKLLKVGNFFEKMQHRSYSDRTFDMLYDMIPEKVERYIFLPFLEGLISKYTESDNDEYWEFLEDQYPAIYHEEGHTGESYFNEAQSFLYKMIVQNKNLAPINDLDTVEWPVQIHDLPTRNWVNAYREFLDADAFERFPIPDDIPEILLESTALVFQDELPYKYSEYFGEPDIEGSTTEIEIYELRKNPSKHEIVRQFMELPEFPTFEEFHNVKQYYLDLKSRTQRENDSDDLFDD